MKLKKDSGGWKVDLSTLDKDEEMARVSRMSPVMVSALDATTKNLEDGKYKTAAEANAAISLAMIANEAAARK